MRDGTCVVYGLLLFWLLHLLEKWLISQPSPVHSQSKLGALGTGTELACAAAHTLQASGLWVLKHGAPRGAARDSQKHLFLQPCGRLVQVDKNGRLYKQVKEQCNPNSLFLVKPNPSPSLPTMHIWTRGQCAAPRHSCLTTHDLPTCHTTFHKPCFPAILQGMRD